MRLMNGRDEVIYTKQKSTGLWLIWHKQTRAGRTLKQAAGSSDDS